MKIFLVGGAVRDRLLNYPVKERDWVVVGASPEEMLRQGYKPVGKDFPVFLHPDTAEEYALARTERKSGHGYTGFTFHTDEGVTLEQDLARRDLTINAIALSNENDYIDPYGGRQDIENRILRHVSLAFTEDPVRVLRIARFAARYHHLGFRIAEETQDLLREIVSCGEMDHLVAERVWQEIRRSLEGENPQIFFKVLRDCQALQKLLPELDALFGVPQPAKYHPEIDTGVHCMIALEQICRTSTAAEARFATLTHDLGKGTTPKDQWPSHKGHEKRGLSLINNICDRLNVPNNWRELALLVAEFHTHCHRARELRAVTLLGTLERLDALRRPERFEHFLLCCSADARGRTGLESIPYLQADYFRNALTCIKKLRVENYLQQGLEGAQLGEALRKGRLHLLEKFKQEYTHE